MRGPQLYRSIEEFEREVLQPQHKAGWSLDDLYQEATFHAPEEDSTEEAEELDFGQSDQPRRRGRPRKQPG